MGCKILESGECEDGSVIEEQDVKRGERIIGVQSQEYGGGQQSGFKFIIGSKSQDTNTSGFDNYTALMQIVELQYKFFD